VTHEDFIDMTNEEFEKEMMKNKKVDLVKIMWRVREKNKELRKVFDEYNGHMVECTEVSRAFSDCFKAIKIYLGEK
jgi:hypothetical protein